MCDNIFLDARENAEEGADEIKRKTWPDERQDQTCTHKRSHYIKTSHFQKSCIFLVIIPL